MRFRARVTMTLVGPANQASASRVRSALLTAAPEEDRGSSAGESVRVVGIEDVEIMGLETTVEESGSQVRSSFFDAPKSIERLAAEQGVVPASFDSLLGDFWPEDESADEFIAALHQWRREQG